VSLDARSHRCLANSLNGDLAIVRFHSRKLSPSYVVLWGFFLSQLLEAYLVGEPSSLPENRHPSFGPSPQGPQEAPTRVEYRGFFLSQLWEAYGR
jgi:hypothetical protein